MDFVILAGAAGILIGFVLLLVFLWRRILFIARKLGRKPASVPKPLESLRNLLLIFLWTSVCGCCFSPDSFSGPIGPSR